MLFLLLKLPINSNTYSGVVLVSRCGCVCKRRRDYILYTSSENYIRFPFWYYDRGLDDIYLPDGITSICDVLRMCNCINNSNTTAVVDQAIVDIAIAA